MFVDLSSPFYIGEGRIYKRVGALVNEMSIPAYLVSKAKRDHGLDVDTKIFYYREEGDGHTFIICDKGISELYHDGEKMKPFFGKIIPHYVIIISVNSLCQLLMLRVAQIL